MFGPKGGTLLKSILLAIFVIGLIWSLGIFRKSQEVSVLNFETKGVKTNFKLNLGFKEPPPL